MFEGSARETGAGKVGGADDKAPHSKSEATGGAGKRPRTAALPTVTTTKTSGDREHATGDRASRVDVSGLLDVAVRPDLHAAPVQKYGGAGPVPDEHSIAAAGVAGQGGALPHSDTIQRAFGHHDIGGVRAHTDDAAHRASRALGAQAYATGNDVAFAGAADLHTAAHEAAHIVQQRGGVRYKGGGSADRYERHADRVADLVVAGQSAEAALDDMASATRRLPSCPRRPARSSRRRPRTAPGSPAQLESSTVAGVEMARAGARRPAQLRPAERRVFIDLTPGFGGEKDTSKGGLAVGVGATTRLAVWGQIGTESLFSIRQTYIDAPEKPEGSGKKPEWRAYRAGNKDRIAGAIYNCVYNNGDGPARVSSAGSSARWRALFGRIKSGAVKTFKPGYRATPTR